MTRLSPDLVEKQINDMWDALADAPRDEGYDKACEEARRVERELRGKLARQRKVDRHAQELLDALRLILDHGTRIVDDDEKPIGVRIEGENIISTRFERAWMGAIEVLTKIEGEEG